MQGVGPLPFAGEASEAEETALNLLTFDLN